MRLDANLVRLLGRLTVDSSVSLTALVISIVALVYTIKAYLLKSGLNIRGTYVLSENVSCSQPFIDSILIENIKDLAVVVLKIYLKIGTNIYLELADYEKDPLILKPFEAVKKILGEIEYYSVGTSRISIRNSLRDRSVRKRLVLKTTDGKYEVNTPTQFWDPVILYFRNYSTTIIRPARATYKDVPYGDKVKFLIDLELGYGKSEVISIHERDHELKIFKDFRLTKEALESKNALSEFLSARKLDGTLHATGFAILDLDDWRKRNRGDESADVCEAVPISKFRHHFVARVASILQNRKMKAANRKIARDAAEKAKTPSPSFATEHNKGADEPFDVI